MRTIFADTFYWVSLINPHDDWHEKVIKFSQSLGQVQIVTTHDKHFSQEGFVILFSDSLGQF